MSSGIGVSDRYRRSSVSEVSVMAEREVGPRSVSKPAKNVLEM